MYSTSTISSLVHQQFHPEYINNFILTTSTISFLAHEQFHRPEVVAELRKREVELHAFRYASGQVVGAAVYSVVRQRSGTTQQLVAAKSRLAKGLMIPRLELVGGHMPTNLLVNVINALDNVPTPQLYGWIDSMAPLHWIKGMAGINSS